MNVKLIGLRAKEGKTVYAMRSAYDSAAKGIPTLLISTEMTFTNVIRRYKEQLNIENFNGVQLSFLSTGSVDIDIIYNMFRNKIQSENIKYIVFDHIPASKKQEALFDKYVSILNNLKEEFGVDILAYYQESMNE